MNAFLHKIETFSQIKLILYRLQEARHKLEEGLFQRATYMKFIMDSDSLKDYEINKFNFLIEQLQLLSKQNHGKCYNATLIKTAIPLQLMKAAISFYICNINCYQALKEYLSLTHPNRYESSFGTLDRQSFVTHNCNTIETQLQRSLTNCLKNKNTCCEIPRKPTHRIVT